MCPLSEVIIPNWWLRNVRWATFAGINQRLPGSKWGKNGTSVLSSSHLLKDPRSLFSLWRYSAHNRTYTAMELTLLAWPSKLQRSLIVILLPTCLEMNRDCWRHPGPPAAVPHPSVTSHRADFQGALWCRSCFLKSGARMEFSHFTGILLFHRQPRGTEKHYWIKLNFTE